MKSEMFNYFNGINHYAYVDDSISTRILSNIASFLDTTFMIRILPVSLSKLLTADNNVLFTKTDSDQNQYGYSTTIDQKGHIHFYVKNNYRQYHLFIKDAYSNILTDLIYQGQGNFRFENFSKANFQTNFDFLFGIIGPSLPFDDW